MYSIGQFSRLSKVSPRMLRHYDKIGLFKPSEVAENGYRYYNDSDMLKLSNIKQLSRFQFSLKEINSILCKNDEMYTSQMLSKKIDSLSHAANQYGSLISEMNRQINMSENFNILTNCTQVDILTGYRQNFLALCKRETTKLNDRFSIIDELYNVVEISRYLATLGTHMTIFHDPYETYDPACTDMELCIPVNHEVLPSKGYYTRIVDGGLYISSIFMGSYDMIGNAYISMLNWLNENKYSHNGPTIERYYRDYRSTDLQNEYITEICMPVIHIQ